MTEEELNEMAEKYALSKWEGQVPWGLIAQGYKDGYQEGLKAKINATTISDCPIKDEWHYPSKGELPNCTRQVLICYGMEERMKFVYWRADLGTFGNALPIEITAWRYIEPPKEEE